MLERADFSKCGVTLLCRLKRRSPRRPRSRSRWTQTLRQTLRQRPRAPAPLQMPLLRVGPLPPPLSPWQSDVAVRRVEHCHHLDQSCCAHRLLLRPGPLPWPPSPWHSDVAEKTLLYCPQNHGHNILQKQEAEGPFPGLDPSWSDIDFAGALVSVSVFQRVLLA